MNLYSKMAIGTLIPKIFKTLSLTVNAIQSNQKLVQFMANVAQEEISMFTPP